MNKYDNLKLLVKSFNFFLQINIFGHRKTLIPIMKKLLKNRISLYWTSQFFIAFNAES